MAMKRPVAVATRASVTPPSPRGQDGKGVEHADDGAEEAQQRRQGDDGVQQPQPTIQFDAMTRTGVGRCAPRATVQRCRSVTRKIDPL